MATLTENARISVPQFTRQSDGSEIVIGNPANGLFLALPHDAVEVLDLLAAGHSIAATQEIYFQKYGEIPDVEELLVVLARKGFLTIEDSGSDTGNSTRLPNRQANYHFASLPESVSKRIFGRTSLVCAGFACLLALVAVIAEPQIMPTRRSLFFRENLTGMLMFTTVVSLLTTFFHEMAHLVAAKARGVSSRLGIGNRLWVLVAETDMTGVWALPKRERYLPILAGPLLDLVSASVLVLILFGSSRGWFDLSATASQLVSATAFIYVLRLIWQLFLFVRTDMYYLYATFYSCKNLMMDTQDYLKSIAARIFRLRNVVDQAHIPPRELRAIRFYALLWLVGRGVAFGVLFLVTLPLAWEYIIHVRSSLASAGQGSTYRFVDALTISALSLLFGVAGFGLWIRELINSRRKNGSL